MRKLEDDKRVYLEMKVFEADEGDFILDLETNQLFEFKEGWYKVIEILDCTLVENYNE